MDNEIVSDWTVEEVGKWLKSKGHDKYRKLLCEDHIIDGRVLLVILETDLRKPPISIQILGDVKRLWLDISELQRTYHVITDSHRNSVTDRDTLPPCSCLNSATRLDASSDSDSSQPEYDLSSTYSPMGSLLNTHRVHGAATNLQPEVKKALLSMGYLFGVTLLTSMTMVIVHDRVPDMKKYPPLPDIFLDNVPHIPWAFQMCEVTGTFLLLMWLAVLFFHKHRFILMRRFFSLSGTVFLLRCVTMLITSLSVPGTHLQCNPRPYGNLWAKMHQAFLIWKAAGMSIQGVRSCGDYMFSGHTVALTMLNFFITEYTPRRVYFLHTFSWLLNMFGIFFILAAHEHYSIDVFVAFYITSRLFLYYHTLANNRALMHLDSKRTRIWFPLFSYFESQVDGIVPNVYEWPLNPTRLWHWAVKKFKSLQKYGIGDGIKDSKHKTKWK